MTSSPGDDLEAEDLLVRARRNELSEPERRRLRALLESSKELELLYLAGVELDRSSALVAGDEALMRRLVELGRAQTQAMARPDRARARRRRAGGSVPARSLAVALGVGVVLGAAVSAAFQLGARYVFAPTPSASSGRAPTAVASTAPRVAIRARPAASVSDDRPTPSAVPSAAFPLEDAPESLARRSHGASPRARDAGASLLFAQAAEARRSGDSEAAIRLYERLVAEYPESVEARDARVSLGKLKLRHRSAAEALQHFQDYPSGTLSAEALWGQAEALRQLSSPAERATLERILREYPDSPYATVARKRLEAMR